MTADESVLSFTQLADAVDEPLTMDNIGTCELVLLCVRPLAAVEYLRQAAPHIGGKPVVIDCCGTKRVVCAAAFPLAKEYGFTYLGGHPMAGTQYSGFGHARANLYHNAPMVIVPPDFDNIELLSRVKELLSPAGLRQLLGHDGGQPRRDDRLYVPDGASASPTPTSKARPRRRTRAFRPAATRI